MTVHIVMVRDPAMVVTQAHVGPPGPVGPGGSELIEVIAAVPLSGHRVIALDADGRGIYASQSHESALSVIGISESAAASGDTVRVRQFGVMAWPAGGLSSGSLWIGEGGVLTQIPPTGGWLRQMGVALSASRVFVSMGEAYWIGDGYV